jgi:phenylacetic acid degradation protein
MIFKFKEYIPVISEESFIHPQATIIGNVIIGKHVYIGPHAVLRGDWGQIIVEEGCNIQENCTLHMFPGKKVILRASAHVGHGAVIHGATLEKNCLIGMNSVIMDDVVVGENTIVGALSFVNANLKLEPNSIYAGNPVKYIKVASKEIIEWKTKGTSLYQQLPLDCINGLIECEPLSEIEQNRPIQPATYFTLHEHKPKS